MGIRKKIFGILASTGAGVTQASAFLAEGGAKGASTGQQGQSGLLLSLLVVITAVAASYYVYRQNY